MGEEIIELFDEKVDGPEGLVASLVGEVGGLAVADLVVKDKGSVGLDEIGVGEQVLVASTRPAVQDHQRDGARGVQVSHDLVPRLGGLGESGDFVLDSSGCFGHGFWVCWVVVGLLSREVG